MPYVLKALNEHVSIEPINVPIAPQPTLISLGDVH